VEIDADPAGKKKEKIDATTIKSFGETHF